MYTLLILYEKKVSFKFYIFFKLPKLNTIENSKTFEQNNYTPFNVFNLKV